MQIYKITSNSAIDTTLRANHSISLQSNVNDLRDSVSISELGKRLSISRSKRLTGGAGGVSEAASLMSKSLSKFEKTLEKMNELTQKAAKDDLTQIERVNMQIEFEELREKIAGASGELNKKFAQLSGHKPKTKLAGTEDAATDDLRQDTRKLLERARDRIADGQKWDIAEKWDEVAGTWVEDDDPEALTVRDKIRASGTVDLMSSVSAKEGLERVESELVGLREMRERFSSFLMSYDGADLGSGLTLSDLPTEEQKNGFQTVLGIMYEIDTETYELSRPTNQMGYMFVRINDMFSDIAGKLAGKMIDESVRFDV